MCVRTQATARDTIDGMATVGDIGETGVIDRIAAQVTSWKLGPPAAPGFELLLGIGDDAAAWRIADGVEVSTTDTVIEGVHFTRDTTPWADLGWKAWAANVSDVAAMGGVPLTGIVTLGLPSDLPLNALDALCDGMLQACAHYRTLLVGGDIVASRDVFVTIAMNGLCAGEPLRRDTAQPGDAIAVTGPLGASLGGLRLLLSGSASAGPAADALVRAHRRPRPRVESGVALVAAGIRCAMDVSDGLVADLGKLCAASGAGAMVNGAGVPVAPELSEVFPGEALRMALDGGEDYQVLFAGPPVAVARAAVAIEGVAVIGEITSGIGVTVVDESGAPVDTAGLGWDHLR